MELICGRPAQTSGREERELRTYDLLDSLGISYFQTDHPAAMTMEDCAAVDEALGVEMCKNLFLCNRQKTDFYLLLMPGDKPFKTKELSHRLGCARLSFADAEYMEEFLDIHPGAVSVMGLMNDKDGRVRLLIDREIYESAEIGCHPCVNTSSMKLKTSDLIKIFLPAVRHEATVVDLPREAAEE